MVMEMMRGVMQINTLLIAHYFVILSLFDLSVLSIVSTFYIVLVHFESICNYLQVIKDKFYTLNFRIFGTFKLGNDKLNETQGVKTLLGSVW